MFITHLPGALSGQKGISDSLELKLRGVSHRVCCELNLGPLPRQQIQWLSYLQLHTAKLFKECMAEEEQELKRISTRALLLSLPNAVTPTRTPFLLLLQSYNFATAINCKIL